MRDYELFERTTSFILAEKAERIGDSPFLWWSDSVFTYRDVDDLSNRYANAFTRLGVQRGDRVAILLPNCPEFLWSLWGLGKLGAVAVPLNTAAKGEMLRYYLDQSETSAVVVSQELLPRLREVLPRLGLIDTVVLHSADRSDVAKLVNDNISRVAHTADFDCAPTIAPSPAESVSWDDPHVILFTSGTTGPSKGAVSPQSQGHAVGRQMSTLSGYRSSDVMYTCLPLFHGNALWYTVYAALWAEASVALYPRFSASQFWSQVRQSRATVINCLGAMANILWQLPRDSHDREHNVRICMMVPNSREHAEGFAERYGITTTSVYAMTENCAITVFSPDDPPEKVPSTGRVRPDVEVRVVDERGVEVAANEVGEIHVRPQERGSMMLGYHRMADATVQTTRDLWFHTGDLGRIDEDGYLFFSDRKKEAIRRRGENISAYEVEMIICDHPAIAEAAAVPVASELGEDDLMVYLVPVAGAELSFPEIIAFCAEHMPYFMVPRYLESVSELPRTPSEKIEKYKLKQSAAQRISELWDREAAGIVIEK